jgi:hypothetical protein
MASKPTKDSPRLLVNGLPKAPARCAQAQPAQAFNVRASTGPKADLGMPLHNGMSICRTTPTALRKLLHYITRKNLTGPGAASAWGAPRPCMHCIYIPTKHSSAALCVCIHTNN